MKLSDRIWITRKARIEASTRLERNALYSQVLIAYYAVFSIIFAILDIKNTTKDYSFQLLIASVVTLSVSIFLPNMRFAERALSLKQCYIVLYGILRRTIRLEKNQDAAVGEFDKIDEEYQKLMEAHENHLQYDYYLAIFKIPRAESTFTLDSMQWIQLICHKAIRAIILLAIFGLPLVLLLCI